MATLERKGGMRVNAFVEVGADYPHEQALFRLDFGDEKEAPVGDEMSHFGEEEHEEHEEGKEEGRPRKGSGVSVLAEQVNTKGGFGGSIPFVVSSKVREALRGIEEEMLEPLGPLVRDDFKDFLFSF